MSAITEEYGRAFFLILNLVTGSLFLYFLNRLTKKGWYKYYWKGFFFIFVGGLLLLFNLMIPLPKLFELIRKVITVTLAVYGFYLLVLGEKLKKKMKNEAKK